MNRPIVPIERKEIGWLNTHLSHLKMAKTSKAEIMLLGDSIAAGLSRYKKVWNNFFPKELNFGIGGDKIQHILW